MYSYYSALSTFLGDAGKLIKRNTLLKVIPQLDRSYTVKFQLNPSKVTSGWSNIVHFTATDRNCCGVGDRVPGVWFQNETTKLMICSSINNNGKYTLALIFLADTAHM